MSQIPNNNIQLTEDEIARRLNKFVVNDEMAAAVADPNIPAGQRRQILQQMLDGAARYAMTASNAVLEHRFGEHQKAFDEVSQIARDMYRKDMFSEFFGEYATLKDYKKLVEDSVTALSSREDLPTDKSQLYKVIADESAARVKSLKPDFVLVPDDKSGAPAGGGSQSAPTHQQPTHTPASTDAGGYQGGTAGGSRQSSVPAGRAEPGLWDTE